MLFNTNLIPAIYKNNKKYTDLCKLLLFILHENIDVRNTLINKIGVSGLTISLDFDESVLGDLQDVILALEANGVVERTYEQSNIRWKLLRKLYVHTLIETDISEEIIEEIRSYFSKGYCGVSNRNAPKLEVKKHLSIWLENNPKIDISEIIPVFKYVVDLNPEFTPNILKLIDIDNQHLTKNLLYYYEEFREGNFTTGTFIE